MSAVAAPTKPRVPPPAASEARLELDDRVEKYTVHPRGEPEREPQDIVIALLDANLREAFERAREIVREQGSVRLIGHGVTLALTWPEWVAEQEGLVLTELGAYARDPLEATSGLRTEYRAWVEEVFARAAPAGAAAHVYYAPTISRLFHPVFEARVFAGGVAKRHPGVRVHLVGREGRAFDELTRQPRSSPLRERAFGPLLAGAWLGALCVTLGKCIRGRLDARTSLDAIERRRATERNDRAVDNWFAHIPDWFRINKHLLDAGTLPAIKAGERVGVILLGSLRGGGRLEADLKKVVDRHELWPGLGALREQLDECVVRQAVMPASRVAFVRGLGDVVRSSASVIWNIARRPAPLHALLRQRSPVSVALAAARLATLDVARSRLAEQAARELVAEHAFRDKFVVFVAASAAGCTSVEQVLREQGAFTVEHTHGSGGNTAWYGPNETSARIQAVWTYVDAKVVSPAPRTVVAGMPYVMKLRPRTPIVPRRVLLLSNYVHRDTPYDEFPYEPFQYELLRVAELLGRDSSDPLSFRWRPHPADLPDAIDRAMAKTRGVELSRDRSLEDDLNDCDVLIASQSTSVIEAVLGDVPFFVQVTPEFDRTLLWVPAGHRFFRAEDVIRPFRDWVELLRRGDPTANDPLLKAKRELFGNELRPVSLFDGLEAFRRAERGC